MKRNRMREKEENVNKYTKAQRPHHFFFMAAIINEIHSSAPNGHFSAAISIQSGSATLISQDFIISARQSPDDRLHNHIFQLIGFSNLDSQNWCIPPLSKHAIWLHNLLLLLNQGAHAVGFSNLDSQNWCIPPLVEYAIWLHNPFLLLLNEGAHPGGLSNLVSQNWCISPTSKHGIWLHNHF